MRIARREMNDRESFGLRSYEPSVTHRLGPGESVDRRIVERQRLELRLVSGELEERRRWRPVGFGGRRLMRSKEGVSNFRLI